MLETNWYRGRWNACLRPLWLDRLSQHRETSQICYLIYVGAGMARRRGPPERDTRGGAKNPREGRENPEGCENPEGRDDPEGPLPSAAPARLRSSSHDFFKDAIHSFRLSICVRRIRRRQL